MSLLIVAFSVLMLATAHAPRLSSDEALLAVAWLDHPWDLNVVIGYLGPLDAWLVGPLSIALSRLFGPAHALSSATLRWIPWFFWFFALLALARELRRHERPRGPSAARACLAIGTLWPWIAINARTGYGHALTLGIQGLIAAEVVRVARTRTVRWIRFAALVGASVEIHPTSIVASGAALAILTPDLWAELRSALSTSTGRVRVGAALTLAAVLFFPVLRHLPYPLRMEWAPPTTWLRELGAWWETFSGHRAFVAHLQPDPWPTWISTVTGLASFSLLVMAVFRALARRRLGSQDPMDRLLVRGLAVWSAATAFLIVKCYQGRPLVLIGNEHYLLVLAPLWAVLLALALSDFSLPICLDTRPRLRQGLALLVAAAFAARTAIPAVTFARAAPDPLLQASRFLLEECPRETCLAWADHFWNYWAIRFHAQDRIDVNYRSYNWKSVPPIPLGDRPFEAQCLYPGSSALRPRENVLREEVFAAVPPFTEDQICQLWRTPGR